MRLTWKLPFVIITMSLAIYAPSISFAQPEFAGPPVVRMVGVLQAFDEQKSHGLNTLTLTLESKKWLFQVNRVDIMSGMDPGTSLLDRIFPPELRLMGNPTILAPLNEPATVGKTITLEGLLYIGDRNYDIASISVAGGTSQ